jgi:23S rRNA (pseudouridine1915-N3)-methyltransferase
MRIVIAAVGRLRNGPEAELTRLYRKRYEELGRLLGFAGLDVVEVEERRQTGPARVEREGELLSKAVSDAAVRIALDERGKTMTSAAFAAWLAELRDSGTQLVAFQIGGADGLSSSVKEGSTRLLSLGTMTFPHLLVRVMLTEQIYRAFSILNGHPYHRA